MLKRPESPPEKRRPPPEKEAEEAGRERLAGGDGRTKRSLPIGNEGFNGNEGRPAAGRWRTAIAGGEREAFKKTKKPYKNPLVWALRSIPMEMANGSWTRFGRAISRL